MRKTKQGEILCDIYGYIMVDSNCMNPEINGYGVLFQQIYTIILYAFCGEAIVTF